MRIRPIAWLTAGAVALSSSIGLSCSVRAQTAPPAARGIEAPIGKVQMATGSATIEHATAVILQANLVSGARQAKVGDFVYRNDIVQTGADGRLGLTFSDGTAFNISSNARMELNEFVYDPNGASNSSLFNLTKGSLTFVAGRVAKTGIMKIETPVGTAGIRGTTPHVEILDDGTVRFSTLIEESDTATTGPPGAQPIRGAPPVRRRQSAPNTRSAQQPVTDNYDRLFNLNLNICKGC
jgi:hypothetical protein